jgi:transposase
VTNRKFTKGRRKVILNSLKSGNYATTAAASAGIAQKTYYEWLKRGRAEGAEEDDPEYFEFVQAVEKAEAYAEAQAVAAIKRSDDWRAHMEYLARRFPDRWGKQEKLELSGGRQPVTQLTVVRTIREGEGPPVTVH